MCEDVWRRGVDNTKKVMNTNLNLKEDVSTTQGDRQIERQRER